MPHREYRKDGTLIIIDYLGEDIPEGTLETTIYWRNGHFHSKSYTKDGVYDGDIDGIMVEFYWPNGNIKSRYRNENHYKFVEYYNLDGILLYEPVNLGFHADITIEFPDIEGETMIFIIVKNTDEADFYAQVAQLHTYAEEVICALTDKENGERKCEDGTCFIIHRIFSDREEEAIKTHKMSSWADKQLFRWLAADPDECAKQGGAK